MWPHTGRAARGLSPPVLVQLRKGIPGIEVLP